MSNEIKRLGVHSENYISPSVSNILNIIRIFAALCVLFGHGFSFYKLGPLMDTTYFPYIQSLAVLVFFVLSGFLTDNSLRKDKYTYKTFMKNRFTRIYVVFALAMLLVLIVDILFIVQKPNLYEHFPFFDIPTALKNIIMMPRLIIFHGNPVLYNEPFGSGRPFWTLFIEWWLYVLYGYIILSYKKYGKVNIRSLLCVVLLLCLFIFSDIETLCCVICFMLGVIVNRIYRKIKCKALWSTVLFAFSIFVFYFASIKYKLTYCIDECIAVALMFFALVLIFKNIEFKMNSKVLMILSGITYPLYLVQYTVIEYIKGIFAGADVVLLFVISMIASMAVAVLVYYLVELFFKKFINRIK